MTQIDQLLHAKWIITCEENNQVLNDHSIAIHQEKILSILPTADAKKQYQATTERHFADHALLPGFINAHTHMTMNAFRGLGDDLELMTWLRSYIWPAEGKWLSSELVYDMSRLAMAEMIRGGTTCFNDMYFFLEETAKAAEEAHMRGFIGMHIMDVPNAWARTIPECFEKSLIFYEQYKQHPLITPTISPQSTYTVDIDTLGKIKALAEKYDLQINIHLQESPTEVDYSMTHFNRRAVQRLHDIGMISPRLIAMHVTQIDQRDREIIEEMKPNIVHCPESNMKLASGICPVQSLLDAGVNIALGTDGAASNNNLDMLGEMHTAALLGKLGTMDACALSAETVLKMATINGAKALRIDDRTGSLTPGKEADIIAINLAGFIETVPVYHPVSQIVYAASREQITDVWIKGKPVLRDRTLLTLDAEALISKAKAWGKRITA